MPPTTFNPIVGGLGVVAIPTGPGVTARLLYRSKAGTTSPLYLLATIADNTTVTYSDITPDSALASVAPLFNTATASRVQLSAIPLGAATVTGRKIYRTAANANQLKFLATLADNTTTTFLDQYADAVLGANAPTADTSALKQPDGMVVAGAKTIIVAGAGLGGPAAAGRLSATANKRSATPASAATR